MRSWPTAPIIRIIKGFAFGGRHIRDEYALRTPDGDYVIDGHLLENSVDFDTGDRIDAWEEITPVPTYDLRRLRSEFRGAAISERLLGALLQVTSHVKPPSESSWPADRRLDVAYVGGQAVGTVEKIVMDGPNPGRLDPDIGRASRESFSVELSEYSSESLEAQC